jgi:hypothetical protein
MNRTVLIILLGLAVGLTAHFSYFRLHRTAPTDTLDGQLAWMKTELQLSDGQFARIKELHVASSPRLRAMAVQVAQLQAEFTAFEKVRRSSDRVDFLEFARFVETRRQVNQACLDSTRQLVRASAELMSPQQRERYIQLVAAAGPIAQSLLN